MPMTAQADEGRRSAQRRRTRRAILDATADLIGRGEEPSVSDIAAAADVSRRTVYLYYPTLDQLVLDATLGTLNVNVDEALAAETSTDPHRRLQTLIRAMFVSMERSLPLGRKLIRLTIEAPSPGPGKARRGHRRVSWIEWAVEPCRNELTSAQFNDLVSALSMVIGWEAFIVLADVRSLSPTAARKVTIKTATAIVDAALDA
jgi:AcrR family transcriptional regulator